MIDVISICEEKKEQERAEAAEAARAAERRKTIPPPRPMQLKISPALEKHFAGQSPEEITAALERLVANPPTPPAVPEPPSPSPASAPAPGPAAAVAPDEIAPLAARLDAIETKLAAMPAEFQGIARAELNRLLRG